MAFFFRGWCLMCLVCMAFNLFVVNQAWYELSIFSVYSFIFVFVEAAVNLVVLFLLLKLLLLCCCTCCCFFFSCLRFIFFLDVPFSFCCCFSSFLFLLLLCWFDFYRLLFLCFCSCKTFFVSFMRYYLAVFILHVCDVAFCLLVRFPLLLFLMLLCFAHSLVLFCCICFLGEGCDALVCLLFCQYSFVFLFICLIVIVFYLSLF